VLDPLLFATNVEVDIKLIAYLSDDSKPILVNNSIASSLISTSSSSHLIVNIWHISFSWYGLVEIISNLSNKSMGIP